MPCIQRGCIYVFYQSHMAQANIYLVRRCDWLLSGGKAITGTGSAQNECYIDCLTQVYVGQLANQGSAFAQCYKQLLQVKAGHTAQYYISRGPDTSRHAQNIRQHSIDPREFIEFRSTHLIPKYDPQNPVQHESFIVFKFLRFFKSCFIIGCVLVVAKYVTHGCYGGAHKLGFWMYILDITLFENYRNAKIQ